MNVPLHSRSTQAAEGLPRRRFTVAEVEAMVEAGIMDEDERVELIGGELVPMSPKGNQHEVVKTALLHRWYCRTPEGILLTPETYWRGNPPRTNARLALSARLDMISSNRAEIDDNDDYRASY